MQHTALPRILAEFGERKGWKGEQKRSKGRKGKKGKGNETGEEISLISKSRRLCSQRQFAKHET